jgi:allantoinase
MGRWDLLIRGGIVVQPEGVPRQADLAIEDGRIAAIEPELPGSAAATIDAAGQHVFPGGIDPHVHFNEPGRTEWEGIASGSTSLAAGGSTLFFDMPLNSHPPTIDGPAFDLKRAAGERAARVDFALWGGLVPDNLDRLDELAERGVIGFKAFMANSGIEDFPAVDDDTLYEGMSRCARLGRIVAVHAENDALTAARARRAMAAGQRGARDYVASRPVIAELEAISRAIQFAGDTGCAVHIVHVSTGRGVTLVANARARGIDVSCETCPHYLALAEDDLEALGAVAKCAPPLRTRTEQETLWRCLADGTVPIVASDHSPAPASMKAGTDFFHSWGGISGCQSTLQVLLTEGYERRALPLALLARVVAAAAAERFGLSTRKGRIAVGLDADLALIDLEAATTLTADDLHYRHCHSPYIGRQLRGRVRRTLLRGRTVYRDGIPVGPPSGRLITAGEKLEAGSAGAQPTSNVSSTG